MGWAGKGRCSGESEVEGHLVYDDNPQESLDDDVALQDGGGLLHNDDPESPGRDHLCGRIWNGGILHLRPALGCSTRCPTRSGEFGFGRPAPNMWSL